MKDKINAAREIDESALENVSGGRGSTGDFAESLLQPAQERNNPIIIDHVPHADSINQEVYP